MQKVRYFNTEENALKELNKSRRKIYKILKQKNLERMSESFKVYKGFICKDENGNKCGCAGEPIKAGNTWLCGNSCNDCTFKKIKSDKWFLFLTVSEMGCEKIENLLKPITD